MVAGGELGSVAVDRVTFIVVLDDNMVGLVCGYRPDGGGMGELVSMWSPEALRSGLGRSLVGAVVDWAAALAVVSLDLWVTRRNYQAQQLYQRWAKETSDLQPSSQTHARNSDDADTLTQRAPIGASRRRPGPRDRGVHQFE